MLDGVRVRLRGCSSPSNAFLLRVTEQIDALELLAADSFNYSCVTRIVAWVIALPILTLLLDFSGVAGGFGSELLAARNTYLFPSYIAALAGGRMVKRYGAPCISNGCHAHQRSARPR